MKLAEIQSPVSTLGGVGPNTERQFAQMNIFTVANLLSTYPRTYDDRTKRNPLASFQNGKVHTIAKVTGHDWFGYGAMKTLKITINDGTATGELIAFNRPFLQKSLPIGCIVAVTGQFEYKYNSLQSTSFEATKMSSGEKDSLESFRNAIIPDSGVLPVYPLTEGLSQKTFRKIVGTALKQYCIGIDDELPEDIVKKRKLLHKKEAIQQIHKPKTISEADEARKTLIYEELFHFQETIAKRAIAHRGTLSIPSNVEQNKIIDIENFKQGLSPKQLALLCSLPFDLTNDQMSVINDMNTDIDKGYKSRNEAILEAEKGNDIKSIITMQRLIQGDVGSGKTLVAFFACLRIADWGGQSVIMAPTELLAQQHAENASKMLENLGIQVAFLTGNIKAKGRTLLLKAIENGDVQLIIGTHALFSKNVHYHDLQLAVIDEQHRFGVMQRNAILDKGRQSVIAKKSYQEFFTPHLVMMSATPIPQTLALTAFGDLDISTIKTMPKGRLPVKTLLTKMGNEINTYKAVYSELQKGHQAYFVYPRIEGEEKSENANEQNIIKSAEEMYYYLSKLYAPYKCALVHSKISEDEQSKILKDFKENKIQVLVATTVVEVGVDVANATCIVIEHADRFGLAELHQLRGRVGRGSLQSYCFLIYSKNISQTGIERMKALHNSTDGFFIAEQDLKLRGPGEFTGTAQSGYMTLGIADLSRDKDILLQARTDAFDLVNNEYNKEN